MREISNLTIFILLIFSEITTFDPLLEAVRVQLGYTFVNIPLGEGKNNPVLRANGFQKAVGRSVRHILKKNFFYIFCQNYRKKS